MAWGQLTATVQPNIKLLAFPEWDAKSRDEVLAEWERLKKVIEDTKALELDFRKYVVDRAFPDKHEGTNTVELNNGYSLKANIKYNYKLDPDNDVVEKTLDELASTGNEGAFLADRLVTWKPSLSLKEYRELAPQYKKIIDKIVTITDATPELKIKAPRSKK